MIADELRDAIQTSSDAQALDELSDGAEGWCLLRESWAFHRWFFEIYGRPTGRGQYSFLLKQMLWKRQPEVVVAGVFRLAMPDGSQILVTGSQGRQAALYGVLPLEWQIGQPTHWQRDPGHVKHAVRSKAAPTTEEAAPPAAQPSPAVEAPPPALTKPPRKPLSPAGKHSEVAATVLKDRLRRWA